MSDDDSITYSRAARVRVALSHLAAEIAESARSLVPTYADSHAYGGDFVESAASLAARARELLTLAVAYERRQGHSWERIGDGLGTSRQSAQERFGAAVSDLDDMIVRAWLLDDPRTPGLPEGAGDTGETAARLDRWVLRHLEGTDPLAHRPEDDPARTRPVSAALEPMDTLENSALVMHAARVTDEHRGDTTGMDDLEVSAAHLEQTKALEIGLARRKIELYERMGLEEAGRPGALGGTRADELAGLLAGARHRLAELEGRDI